MVSTIMVNIVPSIISYVDDNPVQASHLFVVVFHLYPYPVPVAQLAEVKVLASV